MSRITAQARSSCGCQNRKTDKRVTLVRPLYCAKAALWHLLVEDLRAALDAHAPQLPPPEISAPIEPQPTSAAAGARPREPESSRNLGGRLERETGFEPATLSLGKVAGAVAGLTRDSQPVADPRLEPAASIQRISSGASLSKDFASPLLPDFSTSLTVNEVAARLRVCTATVYRLCTAGELPHFRVGAVIRIREEDLAAYQAR